MVRHQATSRGTAPRSVAPVREFVQAMESGIQGLQRRDGGRCAPSTTGCVVRPAKRRLGGRLVPGRLVVVADGGRQLLPQLAVALQQRRVAPAELLEVAALGLLGGEALA